MKKWMAMACAAVVTAGLLTACGSEGKKTAETTTAEGEVAAESTQTTAAETAPAESTVTTAEEADTTEAGRTFIVGFDAEFPPYGYMDENGEYVGFDLDLAREVCARKG